MLIKKDFDDIDWEFGKKGILYRANSQTCFERTVLKSIVDENRPSYWGTYLNNKNEEKITFCTLIDTEMLYFLEKNIFKLSYYDPTPPFSHFPLAMEIDAEGYRDKIYESTEGEGLIIKGPIDIKDINILYSTHINRLEKIINPIDRDMINRLLCRMGDFNREDLLDRYDKDQEKVLLELCYMGHYLRLGEYTKEEKNLTKEYIKLLRGKLRSKTQAL